MALAMSAVILSGGQAQRLGCQEKGLCNFGKESLIDRKIKLFQNYFSKTIVVVNKPELYSYLNKDIILVKDENPYQGPLAGLVYGLQRSSTPINFVTAVDMPFVNFELLDYLQSFVQHYEIVVARIDNHIEPLFSFYSNKILPTAQKMMSQPNLGLQSLIKASLTKIVEEKEIMEKDTRKQSFINLNTPEDFINYSEQIDQI